MISKSVSTLKTLDDFNSLNVLAVNPHEVHNMSDHLPCTPFGFTRLHGDPALSLTLFLQAVRLEGNHSTVSMIGSRSKNQKNKRASPWMHPSRGLWCLYSLSHYSSPPSKDLWAAGLFLSLFELLLHLHLVWWGQTVCQTDQTVLKP